MKPNIPVHTRYPLGSVFTYNGLTIVHFILGGAGIIVAYHSWLGYLLGPAYVVFAFIEMYVLMPLKVCPNCPYSTLDNSLCISGMNIMSKRFARKGNITDFGNRAKGTFCPNNLYIGSLTFPIIILIPALLFAFSFGLLAIWLGLIGLLLFRFFVVFPKIACVHCRAKNICPNAKAMGLSAK